MSQRSASGEMNTDSLTLSAANTLQTGDAVVYKGGFGTYWVGLEFGATNYVILPDGSDGSEIRLSVFISSMTTLQTFSWRRRSRTPSKARSWTSPPLPL